MTGSRSISCPAAPARMRSSRSRSTVEIRRSRARLNDAVYRVTVNGAPAGETGRRDRVAADDRVRDGVRRRLQRQEDVHRRADELHRLSFGAVVQHGRAAPEPDDPLGPGPRRRHRARAAGVVLLAELQHAGAADRSTRTARSSASRHRRRPDRKRARSATPASTITISSSMLLNEQNTQPVRIDYAPVIVPQPDDPDHHRPATSATRCGSSRRRTSRGSSSARRRSTICARSIPS